MNASRRVFIGSVQRKPDLLLYESLFCYGMNSSSSSVSSETNLEPLSDDDIPLTVSANVPLKSSGSRELPVGQLWKSGRQSARGSR
jgi:hypothetical protein